MDLISTKIKRIRFVLVIVIFASLLLNCSGDDNNGAQTPITEDFEVGFNIDWISIGAASLDGFVTVSIEQGETVIVTSGLEYSQNASFENVQSFAVSTSGSNLDFQFFLHCLQVNSELFVKPYVVSDQGTKKYGPVTSITTIEGRVYEGNLEITNLTDYIEFAGQNYTKITGDLTIRDIDDLIYFEGQNYFYSLDELVEITGDLKIYSLDNLINFDEFCNLKKVGGSIVIYDLDQCLSISGFNALESVGDFVNINLPKTNVANLANTLVSGNFDLIVNCLNRFENSFQSLVTLDGFLRISSPGLSTIDNSFGALENLGALQLGDLPQYTDMSEFYDVQINGLSLLNTGITEVTGFNDLSFIENFSIMNNNNLTHITGFSNVLSVGSEPSNGIKIKGNRDLIDITGLSNLEAVSGGFLEVSFNVNLDVTAFQNLVSINGFLNISSNNTMTTLNGLNNLNLVQDYIVIQGNDVLTDFCALVPLLTTGTWNGASSTSNDISFNEFNPTFGQIAAGDCSE
ncbi:MAG: hypothetical protein ABJM06_08215 [Gilvibacter sp.]